MTCVLLNLFSDQTSTNFVELINMQLSWKKQYDKSIFRQYVPVVKSVLKATHSETILYVDVLFTINL